MPELSQLSQRSNFLKFSYLFALISYLFFNAITTYADSILPDPKNLIAEMSIATSQLNYDGIFTYRYDKKIDTMRIIHKNKEGDIFERLISLNGNRREIVRENDKVKYFFPENKIAIIERSKLGQLLSSYIPDTNQSISKFYVFDILGDGRIAGRNAWIVNIKPIDRFRYGYQLWIDKKSKLLLRSRLKNYQGANLEDVMFVKLDVLEDISDSLFKPSFSSNNFTWINNIKSNINSDRAVQTKWKASWIPKGFLMTGYTKDPMPTSKIPVDHFIYTDGLATISVYVEKLNHQQPINSETTNFGGVNTYSVSTNGYQITAVGEVPKTTVELIVNSVKLSP